MAQVVRKHLNNLIHLDLMNLILAGNQEYP